MTYSLKLRIISRSALLFIIAITFPLFLASTAQADPATKLYGVVTDSQGKALAGIGISVVGPNGFTAEISTDGEGAWEVPIISKGSFSATINVDDLPEGQALTNPEKSTVKANVFMLGVDLRLLFPVGPGVVQASLLERSAQLTLDGILLGLVIALAALGLSLIFGTTGLTNFAHGEILTLAGLLTYYLSAIAGLPVLMAAPLAVILGALISGFLQDKYLWKPLRRQN